MGLSWVGLSLNQILHEVDRRRRAGATTATAWSFSSIHCFPLTLPVLHPFPVFFSFSLSALGFHCAYSAVAAPEGSFSGCWHCKTVSFNNCLKSTAGDTGLWLWMFGVLTGPWVARPSTALEGDSEWHVWRTPKAGTVLGSLPDPGHYSNPMTQKLKVNCVYVSVHSMIYTLD